MARKQASEAVDVVEQVAATTAKTSGPAAKKAGKVAVEVASTAATFVFEATREAVRRMPGRLYGPPCPRCGAKTVIRRNHSTGHVFAACSAWHDTGCNFTADVVYSDIK